MIGFLTLNYFFTPPVGTLTVSEPRNLLALGVFVAVAAAVATVVDRASSNTPCSTCSWYQLRLAQDFLPRLDIAASEPMPR